MPPNSGLLRGPIRTRRSGWQKSMWRFATHRAPAPSWRRLLPLAVLVDALPPPR